MKIKTYFSDKRNTFMPGRTSPDVLKSKEGKMHRQRVLKAAVALGLFRNKESNLEFIDETGRNISIISKIVGLKGEHAILQNNRTIPINKISTIIV